MLEEQERAYGLWIAREPRTPASETQSESLPLFDVIFVHGLGGKAQGTWTHDETQAFWPEWLPEGKGMSNVRVSTFGYKAEWAKIWEPANVLGIAGFAGQLIQALEIHYHDKGNVSICACYIVDFV